MARIDESRNLLAYGDNLDVLRRHIASASVDLVYLDPPFNSNADYNVLFEEHGERAAAQIRAFGDTWRWDEAAADAYQSVVEAGGSLSTTMRAFRTMLSTSDMLAYLAMMAPRLIELRRVLKPSGSLFLHCDPTASHYLKLLLDAIFGPRQFRNEIEWCYTGPSNTKRWFPRKHDVILFYVRDEHKSRFYPDAVRVPYRPTFTMGGSRSLAAGKRDGNYQTGLAKQFARGKVVEDYWTDIPALSVSKERLGYPTQKPVALLERILTATTEAGDLVLDPFCGCGTTIDAAEKLGRRWIGIDVTHVATSLIKHRLTARHGPEVVDTLRTIGEPTTADDAAALAAEDPYQFQSWALGLVGARQRELKKGKDGGIDGRLLFHDGRSEDRTYEIILSVKGGHINPSHVRDLVGVLDREGAQVGVLITLDTPTASMRAEAAGAGFFESPSGRYPRVQLRTVVDLLAGRGIQYPPEPATVYRPTLFAPEDVPEVPRTRRTTARDAGRHFRAQPGQVPESPLAVQLRARMSRQGKRPAPASSTEEGSLHRATPDRPQYPYLTKEGGPAASRK